ncbi:LPS export ABC transporter periplasmic protein LptC [Acinetobacter sp. S40]|uniref:LPS export ABC transporter periplasmic protein LptC n=1 Tax=unclassified Acinetobacter TaxID=196816 RepID=UPI00190CB723|nr:MULTISPECIES: LPS export ABC transporter periplasmic protein LptC [unclassified Acinetobacter]MBJ9986808.1 LPS export ABC transporter periplasmic protein LptC [Acinetobacter sp. S40]MBK0065123.1 LPS export ABC transporter periplasmic protein LptC [Acinetobacter sp. S55]MBK0068340.1 LPS export ABC transporter periplasmic protein LptC [Acinetobacter sp. S54]
MDTRVLYIVAIAIAAVSGGYYYYSGKANKLEADTSRNMTYSAQDIHLTQTNDQGHLYIRAQVDRLEQNMQKQTSKLENLHASMYQNGQVNATFFSKVANGYDDNEKVILSGDVVATKLAENGEIIFRTDELTTYPKTKIIETTHQVDVQSSQASFVSSGLKANLENGQYEFFNIRGKYAPNS